MEALSYPVGAGIAGAILVLGAISATVSSVSPWVYLISGVVGFSAMFGLAWYQAK